MSSLEQKRVFLIASPIEGHRLQMQSVIETHLTQAVLYEARDGSEAWMKLVNVPPHVLIVEDGLEKIESAQLLKNVFADRRFEDCPALFVSDPHEKESFVDEVVTGRLQFVSPKTDAPQFARALTKALNYAASREKAEFHLRFLSPGDVLLKEGDKADFVYLVKKGTLKASHQRENQSLLLGKIEAGEFVGEMAYINGEPRSADVEAVTDCELIEIPVDQLDHLLFQRPSWSKALMATLSKRVKKANRQRLASAPRGDGSGHA